MRSSATTTLNALQIIASGYSKNNWGITARTERHIVYSRKVTPKQGDWIANTCEPQAEDLRSAGKRKMAFVDNVDKMQIEALLILTERTGHVTGEIKVYLPR